MNNELRIKDKNILYIDTSESSKVIIRLQKNKEEFVEEVARENTRAQIALNVMESLLKKSNTSLEEIDKIEVKRGPGSYTGLKVGVSIANALSFALQIAVNDKEVGELETPIYK